MISFEEANRIVLAKLGDFGVEDIPLRKGLGRILREEWRADRAMPPFDRVTMDGIAIQYNSTHQKDQYYPIEGICAAGQPQMRLLDKNNCIEVMTGCILPLNTDTVIRYEDLTIESDKAHINEPINKGQNIHRKGEDRSQGDLLLSPGIKISASEIGVAPSIGQIKIQVSKLPKTIIISTGNELVEINKNPLDHQIRKSNVYQLEAALKSHGVPATTMHLDDNYDNIVSALQEYIEEYDLILMSGGVSMGKFDYLPKAFDAIGVNKLFHKVLQRPGKPLWFGTHDNGCTVFALPGNPISSFMCTQVYVLNWLQHSLSAQIKQPPTARLTADVSFNKPLTYFLEVGIEYNEEGQLVATPKRGHGSGDLANLMNGDAFMRLPADKDSFKKGEAYPIYFYR